MSDVINGVPRELLELLTDAAEHGTGINTPELMQARALLTEQPQSAPAGERDSYWFSLLMNCAAELETASYCIPDKEAKRVAQSGANYYREQAGAAWQRTQSAGVPEGYALVPIDPTPKMLVAYMGTDGAVKRWKAMVAAAKAEGAHV